MIDKTLRAEYADLAQVQKKAESDLLAKQNVVGVALGNKSVMGEDTGEPAVLVLVSQKLDPGLLAKEDMVPKKLGDQKTDVVEVGTIFAGQTMIERPQIDVLSGDGAMNGAEHIVRTVQMRTPVTPSTLAPQVLQQRVRPVMGGFSVGHYLITAGTIGTCCYDLTPFPSIPNRYYILSNNHVLANSNQAQIGDPILQPGPVDGGTSADVVARLSRFVPIQFKTATTAPLNYVDAAIAEIPFHLANRQIYWIGHVRDLYEAPAVGDILQKTGRTTNYTTGRVTAINATVDVNYGGGRVARFANQILTTNMSAGGDSGSLVLNLDEAAVGLLFAGSATVTVINNIAYVQALLGVRVHEK